MTYQKMYSQCSNWKEFLAAVTKAAAPDDRAQIFVSDFLQILKDFEIKISNSEFENLKNSFPGHNEGDN